MVEEMREPTFLVLTALTDGRQHGYALIKTVESLSAGRVRLRPGSLYATLDRLAEEGLIREAGSEVVDGRTRRYYELSGDGMTALGAQVERLQRNLTRARSGLRRLQAGEATA